MYDRKINQPFLQAGTDGKPPGEVSFGGFFCPRGKLGRGGLILMAVRSRSPFVAMQESVISTLLNGRLCFSMLIRSIA